MGPHTICENLFFVVAQKNGFVHATHSSIYHTNQSHMSICAKKVLSSPCMNECHWNQQGASWWDDNWSLPLLQACSFSCRWYLVWAALAPAEHRWSEGDCEELHSTCNLIAFCAELLHLTSTQSGHVTPSCAYYKMCDPVSPSFLIVLILLSICLYAYKLFIPLLTLLSSKLTEPLELWDFTWDFLA